MRCDQLARIGNGHLAKKWTFEVLSPPPLRKEVKQRRFAKSLKGAIVIGLKNFRAALTPHAVEILRANVRGLCIDHLDVPPDQSSFDLFDVHIAASFRSANILKNTASKHNGSVAVPEIMHVVHHADPRLTPLPKMPERFRLGYFGKLSNTYLPDTVNKDVYVPSYESDKDFVSVFESMRSCPLHYCARRPSGRRAVASRTAKPFTKGFNAAAVGANVLVNRQVDDAIHYLGQDYPFLLDDLSDASLSEGVAYARDAFGGPDWKRGLEVMRSVQARTGPPEVAKQLAKVLAVFD